MLESEYLIISARRAVHDASMVLKCQSFDDPRVRRKLTLARRLLYEILEETKDQFEVVEDGGAPSENNT